MPRNITRLAVAGLCGSAALVASGVVAANGQPTNPMYQSLRKDVIINADMWAKKPSMLAAGLGFVNIIGVNDAGSTDPGVAQAAVQAVDGAFNVGLTCASTSTPPQRALTSAATPSQAAASGLPVYYGAGLPVEFSWPVRPSTVDPTDFRVTLNDGSVVTPVDAAVNPNYEYNERSTVVLFGAF